MSYYVYMKNVKKNKIISNARVSKLVKHNYKNLVFKPNSIDFLNTPIDKSTPPKKLLILLLNNIVLHDSSIYPDCFYSAGQLESPIFCTIYTSISVQVPVQLYIEHRFKCKCCDSFLCGNFNYHPEFCACIDNHCNVCNKIGCALCCMYYMRFSHKLAIQVNENKQVCVKLNILNEACLLFQNDYKIIAWQLLEKYSDPIITDTLINVYKYVKKP